MEKNQIRLDILAGYARHSSVYSRDAMIKLESKNDGKIYIYIGPDTIRVTNESQGHFIISKILANIHNPDIMLLQINSFDKEVVSLRDFDSKSDVCNKLPENEEFEKLTFEKLTFDT